MCLLCARYRQRTGHTGKLGLHTGTPEQKKAVRDRVMNEYAVKKSFTVPSDMLDVEVRAQRFYKIRKLMRMSQIEFSRAMGIDVRTLRLMESGDAQRVKLCHLLLAEFLLRDYQQATTEPVPVNLPEDDKVRTQIYALDARGKSVDEISRELAVRPEVVRHYIALLD